MTVSLNLSWFDAKAIGLHSNEINGRFFLVSSQVRVRAVHNVRVFLIATAIFLIGTNGLYRTQWKCSHYATATTSSSKLQSQSEKKFAQCE